MISNTLKEYIEKATSFAQAIESKNTSLVHLLLSILDNDEVQRTLNRICANYSAMRPVMRDKAYSKIIREKVVSVEDDAPKIAHQLSPVSLYALNLAITKAKAKGAFAEPIDLLASMLEIHDDGNLDYNARSILNEAGVTSDALKNASCLSDDDVQLLQRGLQEQNFENRQAEKHSLSPTALTSEIDQTSNEEKLVLKRYFRDITKDAEDGKIEQIVGREKTVSDVEIILSRHKKGNPILVGEPGVGKTSLVEELARKIVIKNIGSKLIDARIFSLDLSALVGGTRYRGDLEERVKTILDVIKKDKNRIIFIDEIHALMTPGSSASAAADLLKPALASGEIRCIGATTLLEYKKYFEADGALSRRFMPVFLEEPSRNETVAMLTNTISQYEASHGVKFTDEIIKQAIDKSIYMIPERRLPDKAIDIIDDIGARASISGITVANEEVLDLSVAARTGKNKTLLNLNELSNLLADEMVGQEGAARELAAAFMRQQLPNLPEDSVSTIALVGSNSKQNTSAVKALVKVCDIPCADIDMIDYQEDHASSGLIGAPPGYIGSDNGGKLYDTIMRAKGGVLFIKNLDKASAEAKSIISAILSSGLVVDSTQRTVSLASVQIMLSFTIDKVKNSIGFAPSNLEFHGYNEELVDSANEIVEIPDVNLDVAGDYIRARINKLKKRTSVCGSQMLVDASTLEGIENYLKSLNVDINRSFRDVIERPVLDYMLNNNGDFTVNFEVSSVSIKKHEAA